MSFFFLVALVYRSLNTEITPGMVFKKCFPLRARKHAQGLRKHELAEALGSYWDNGKENENYYETLFAEAPGKKIIAEGSVEARCFEVPSKRKQVSAEARWRKGCCFKKINRNINHSSISSFTRLNLLFLCGSPLCQVLGS